MWVKALLYLLFHVLTAANTVAAAKCYDTGNFTTNSTYGINRDRILASLPANVSANGGFYTATIGQDPNKVYALGLCPGDVSQEECFTFVNSTIYDDLVNCPNQKEALSWGKFHTALVRYADKSFFGMLELEPTIEATNVNEIKSNLTEFNQVWEDFMDSVVKKASKGTSRLKFSTWEKDYTAFQKIYALMQCTPDLSQSDCETCLRDVVGRYQSSFYGKQGGFVQNPNCWFRWDLYPFYKSKNFPAAPSPFPSLSPPPTRFTKEDRAVSARTIYIVVVPIIILVAVVLIASAIFFKTRRPKLDTEKEKFCEETFQFDLNTIRVATNDFSNGKKLGQGGSGTVYKGKLNDGRDVAVKRLSVNSGQGKEEFKNEVLLVANLQHKNLVRLLGFCLEKNERLLIYEFVPNSSLDRFIFDAIKRLALKWEKRYRIIEGIARGILYLHQDSQYRIIHRDLKAANVLLDVEMNPKISDFGLAKLFVADQTHLDTKRIFGTFGYMAPEYANNGQFSVKTDVYSFGILVLEIVSGKRINCCCDEETGESLVTHAWKIWNKGTPLKLVDPILMDGSRSEMMRCIHIGLLCVQETISRRPTMDSVVLMLSSSSMSLPVPSKPAFLMHSVTMPEERPKTFASNRSRIAAVNVTVNEASLTDPYPR